MNQLELLTPILTLIIWTFLIFLMMAFGRVRFMNNPQDAAHSKDYKDNCLLGLTELQITIIISLSSQ